MPRRTQNINSLGRGKVRASMNKYNLFNLYKKVPVSYNNQTLFQQKWRSKQETRAYHGEHLTESRFKTLFSSSLESVAQLDASLKGSRVADTPLALQTYAVLEKRLEVALFRSMFASSVRQARQFILAGDVSVNGITMKHPSFPLKAGDLFSVRPDKVLMAMGRPKPSLAQALKVDRNQIAAWNRHVVLVQQNPKQTYDLMQAKPDSLDTINGSKSPSAKLAAKAFNSQLERTMLESQKATTRESVLSKVLDAARNKETVDASLFSEYGTKNAEKCAAAHAMLVAANHPLVEASDSNAVTAFIKKKKPEFDTEAEHSLAGHVKQLMGEVVKTHQEYMRVHAKLGMVSESAKSVPFTTEFSSNKKFHPKLDSEAILEDELVAQVSLPWQTGLFGRQDPSKPYFTPWVPRPFLGCFAILPAHIEISFTTCHAIYLRDPIARPGNSEVITPLPVDVHERAYMYYGRKGL